MKSNISLAILRRAHGPQSLNKIFLENFSRVIFLVKIYKKSIYKEKIIKKGGRKREEVYKKREYLSKRNELYIF